MKGATLTYRIRSIVGDHDPKKDASYRNHLRKYDKGNRSDLWRYFYWDFFHDGVIEDISFSADLHEASFKIWCPNIKRYINNEDYEYVNAAFICRFIDVKYFAIEQDQESKGESGGKTYFLSSEINSLSELIDKYSDHEEDYGVSSLVIELDEGYMSIVFWSLDVEAVEPAAFSLMLSDRHHEIPIFQREQEVS